MPYLISRFILKLLQQKVTGPNTDKITKGKDQKGPELDSLKTRNLTKRDPQLSVAMMDLSINSARIKNTYEEK